MKRRLALLFVVIMILSCMPVMAATAPAGADAAVENVTAKAAKTGWVKTGKYYRYYYASGKYYANTVKKIENKYFGFNEKGYLCCGWFKIKNMTFYGSVKLGAKGIGVGQILTGYRKIGNDYYYLHPQKCGARASGFIPVGKKLYYFSPANGKQRRTKGWFFVGNYMYYVQADGSIATNTTIDGYKIGANGAVSDPYGYDKKAQGYSSETRYMVMVDKSRHYVNFYKGSKGHWVNIKRNILCTIGKPRTANTDVRISAAAPYSTQSESMQATSSTLSFTDWDAQTPTRALLKMQLSARTNPTAASAFLWQMPSSSGTTWLAVPASLSTNSV